MSSSSPGSASLLERQTITQRYPQARVIVLDDDVNTFQHVVDCPVSYTHLTLPTILLV